ncbi:hypothetical protein MKX03_008420, partial [Papaver bracteatum]
MVAAIFTLVYLSGGKESVFGPKAHLRRVACLVVTCIPLLYRFIQSIWVGCTNIQERRQFFN